MENPAAAEVVFVDDEPDVCRVVQKTLARAGVQVRCFMCAGEALAHVAAHRCDLLITDVRMPERDGLDLLREVKAGKPWIPVLMVTGYGEVPLAVRALRAGAADFVEKPLDRDRFLQAVEHLLAHRARPAGLQGESLTKTERTILHLVLEGRSNREIAAALNRSLRTIEAHRCHGMQKLGASNIVELLQRAAGLGLLPTGPARCAGESKDLRKENSNEPT